jgi:choline dehydrogenase-like flavoprotein
MNRIDSTPARFDAIIVGSGAGGCAAAYKLASAGLRVALLEKGGPLPRDASTLDFEEVVRRGAFRSAEPWSDGRGAVFAPEEHFNVGGKTKWYGAALLRYARNEFDAEPAHQCLPWPISYDELAPYYDEAERLLDVRTFDAEADLARMLAQLQRCAPAWRTQPLQLALKREIVQHPLEAARFDGFASLADLKGDGETAFLARVKHLPGFTLLTGAQVDELIGDRRDPLRIEGVRLHDGRTLYARAVLLAAGALHSPRLLQRYVDRHSEARSLPGAALVGRNLKLHLLTAVIALSVSAKRDLLRKTTLLLNDALPHSSVQPLGFDGELIGALMPKLLPRAIARELGARAYGFFLQTEDGSHPENRVIDAGQSRGELPVLDYDARRTATALREHRTLVAQFRLALARIGMLAFAQRIGVAGSAHASGTLAAGSDPATSVVGPDGRVHGFDALYVVDGSALPRSSRVNPSLTIYAWSLRAAASLSRKLAATRTAEEALA